MTPEREQIIYFSLPILDSGLQIMVSENQGSGLAQYISSVNPFLPIKLIALLLLFLFVVANTLLIYDWSTGRKNYPGSYAEGLGKALWWTAITLATGGYGDKEPSGAFRRIIVVAWIFFGIVLVSNLTAAITTASTLSAIQGRINDVNDLPGKRVATVANTTSAQYLSREGIEFEPVQRIEVGFQKLETAEVDALVFAAPVLQHYASHAGRGKVRVVGGVFRQEYYGIALPTGSQLREPINRTILEMKADGTFQRIFDKWFKTAALGQ